MAYGSPGNITDDGQNGLRLPHSTKLVRAVKNFKFLVDIKTLITLIML